VWPSPEVVTLTLYSGASSLLLPVRPPRAADARLAAFGEPEAAPPTPFTDVPSLRGTERRIVRDLGRGETTVLIPRGWGRRRLHDIDVELHGEGDAGYALVEGDPLSARAWTSMTTEIAHGSWRVRSASRTRMSATRKAFNVAAELDAFEGDRRVFSRSWSAALPRDGI
jgi:hypothetical protein